MTPPKPSLIERIRSAQPTIIEALTLLSPYAAGALPAALTGGHVMLYLLPEELGVLKQPVAAVAGFALEAIGIAAGWTIVQIVQKTRNVLFANNWRLKLAIYAGAHYVVGGVATNVLMVAFGANEWTKLISVTALSTMSVPATIIAVLAALDVIERTEENSKKQDAKDLGATLRAERAAERREERRDNLAARVRIAEIKAGAAQNTPPAPVLSEKNAQNGKPYTREQLAEHAQNMRTAGKATRDIVIELFDVYGAGVREIGRAANTSPSNVSTILNGAKSGVNNAKTI